MEETKEQSTKIKRGPKRGGRLGGVLTKRDRLACLWVCEQGVMTVDQLWKAFWWTPESNSPRYAYDRVGWLASAGFLAPMRSPYSLKTFFKATKQAQEAASDAGEGLTLVPLQTPPISEIGHSDGLTELRLAVTRADRLGSLPGIQPWRTDRVLSIDPSFPKERFYSHLPDAIWVTPSGRRIAVEYERTRKVISKLRIKVEAFSRELARGDRAFDRVLWVATPGTMSGLSQILKNHPDQTMRTMDQFFAELKGKGSES